MSETDSQLVQSFCDAVPVGVCLVDLSGRIVQWNSAAELITGYLGLEVTGRAYRGDLLIHSSQSHAPETQCPLLETLREGQARSAELYLRHKLGHRLAVYVQAFPLRNAMGSMVGAAEIFTLRDAPAWSGRHSDHEFELATGLTAIEETRLSLEKLLSTPTASSSAVILIEISEVHALLRHGGTGILHQAIRVVAKTVSGAMPSRHRVGCWSDWRLVVIATDCTPDRLAELMTTLTGIGSTCSVKWWGDRLEIGIKAVARFADFSKSVDELMQELEVELKNSSDRNL